MSTPPTTPQVHATGLGHAEIRVGESMITPISDRLFALAFHFCVRAGEYIPRDELVALFWGDREPTKGRHSLRQMLYRLRQMGVPLVDAGDAVHLPDAAVACDVRAVLREGWERDATGDEVRAGGEQIAGGPQAYTEAYRDWYDALEARVRTQIRRAALQLMGAAKREGRWGGVEEWALHVLRHDALNEEATLALAESMVMTGSKVRALEVLDGYLAELGDRADRIGLPAKVLRKRITARNPHSQPTTTRLPPLIGREEQMRTCIAFLQGEIAETTLLLVGPPGTGKTRIATDVEAHAQLLGHVVIEIRQTSSERRSTLAGLHVASAQLLDAPGSAGASPEALATLKSLSTAHSPGALSHVPRQGHTSDEAIRLALSDVLSAVADERPVLIIIEDIHHLPTLDDHPLIVAAMSIGQQDVRLLISSRTIPARNRDTSTQTLPGIHRVAVGPLPFDASQRLAEALLAANDRSSSRTARQIAERSGGIPLFIHALATHTHSTAQQNPLPESLQRHITERLASFSREKTDVCEAIHFLGSHSRLAWVRESSLAGASAFHETLEHLEREGVVTYHHSGVLRLHDCWAEVLEPRISGATRAHRSLIAAETILSRIAQAPSHEATVHAALLLEAAGEYDRAFSLFSTVGESLYNKGLATDALDVFRRAANVARTATQMTAAALNIALAEYSLGTVDASFVAATNGLRTTCDRSQTSVDKRLLLQSQLADTAWRLEYPFADILTALIAAITDGRASPPAQHQAAFTAIRILFNDRHDTRTAKLTEYITRSAAHHGPTYFSELCLLIAAAERGAAQETSAIDERLARIDHQTLPVHVTALGLRYRSQALRWGGFYERALALSQQAAVLTATYGLKNEASILAIQSGFLHLDVGDITAGLKASASARSLMSSGNKERETALWHLEARALIHAGDISEAHALLARHKQDIAADSLLKRKASAAAMLGYTASIVGEDSLASEMLAIATTVLLSEIPSLQLDFPCDIVIAALSHLQRDEECSAIADDYCSRRAEVFPVRVAPSLSNLTAWATTRDKPTRQ